MGSGSAVTTSVMGLINPSVGIVLTSSTALITSIAILITNEYISKSKIGYIKLRDWINEIQSLYEKTFETSMVDKEIDQKEADELKKIYNHYLDTRKKIMKIASFKVEDVFGDVVSNVKFSEEQVTKLTKIFAKTIRI